MITTCDILPQQKKGEAPETGNLPYLMLRYGTAYCCYGMTWQVVQA
jgi:hypothetical protein